MSKQKFDNYEVDFSRCIGWGSYGKVYLGVHLETKDELAVKVSEQTDQEKYGTQNSEPREISTLKAVQSQNIVKFFDILKYKGRNFIIFELCERNLEQEMSKKYPGQYLKEKQISNIFRQICNGFKVIHQNKIIHRDLKPENILVKDGFYKVADFGLARFIKDQRMSLAFTVIGTPLYNAPQILMSYNYDYKCDIYSLGLILYRLLYCRQHLSWSFAQLFQIIKYGIKIPSSITRPIIWESLFRSMTKIDPKQRIDWPELFLHELIRTEDTDDQQTKQAKINIEPVTAYNENRIKYLSIIQQQFFQKLTAIESQYYHSGLGALSSIILFYSRAYVNQFYESKSPYPSVDNQTWKIFRTTNQYWSRLREAKQSLNIFEKYALYVRNVLKQKCFISLSKNNQKIVLLLCENDFKFQQKSYLDLMGEIIKVIKQEEITNIGPLLEALQKIKQPLNSLDINMNYQEEIEKLKQSDK